MKRHGSNAVRLARALMIALTVAGCGAAPDAHGTDANAAGLGEAEVTVRDAIIEDARGFMEGYAADLLAGDSEDISARYSRRGTYMVLPGERRLVPYDTIVGRYGEGGSVPDTFEWRDLAYEVVGEDAVLVIGAFHWRSAAGGGVLGNYTALLAREDGQLRIRLENESFDNLPPTACAGRAEPCDLPLDAAALARYSGEYDTSDGPGRARVFAEEGRLMMERPGTPPGRLLHEGAHAFRVEGAPWIRVLFVSGGERATSYIAFTGMLHTSGSRAR